MYYSEEQIQTIHRDFEHVRELAKGREKQLFHVLEEANEEERICLEYLFAYMPLSDLAFYDGQLFLDSVRASIHARNKVSWGKDLDAETFLNYVLALRLNNEDLTAHRALFFEELYPRVESLTMKGAGCETNYWCFEKATYQSTDSRTVSPLTIIKSAYGRCGEESVFLVSALRSLAIPARQVYTPWWAHCDDNHAWVEVFIDGEWKFLGACEPDPILNQGWFTTSARRGMLIRARNFSKLPSTERVMPSRSCMTQINCTENYAPTKELTVWVRDNGKPVSDARVSFELVNYGRLSSIYEAYTDEDGKVEILTGLGDLIVHASVANRYQWKKVDLRTSEAGLVFDCADFAEKELESYTFELVPPERVQINDATLSDEMKEAHDQKMAASAEKRKDYEATFARGEKARDLAKAYPEAYQEQIIKFLEDSNGNYDEIIRFLQKDDQIKDRVGLLSSLVKKDFSDSTAHCLEEHFQHGMQYRDKFTDDDFFYTHILCPRISTEFISPWRQGVYTFFNEEQKQAFRRNPSLIYTFIKEHIEDCSSLDYETIFASPEGLLELGMGSIRSMRILFVAICRSLGIPAKLNHQDMSIEYYADNEQVEYIRFEQEGKVQKDARITIQNAADSAAKLEYFKNISIAKLENGIYRSLNVREEVAQDRFSLAIEPGFYRVLTSMRQDGGAIHAKAYFVELAEKQEKLIEVSVPEKEIVVSSIDLGENILAKTKDGDEIDLLSGNDLKKVLIWLETGREPTEHILNEILEDVDAFKQAKEQISLIVEQEEALQNDTLQEVLAKTDLDYFFAIDDSKQNEHIMEKLSMESIPYPLVIAFDEEKKHVFHSSGYNVSLGHRILQYLETES